MMYIYSDCVVIDLQIFSDTRYVAWDLNGVMLDIVGWCFVRHKIKNIYIYIRNLTHDVSIYIDRDHVQSNMENLLLAIEDSSVEHDSTSQYSQRRDTQ
jgi:hypothetical protein